MSENIRINAKRERDRTTIFRFFRFYLWTTPVLTLLTLLMVNNLLHENPDNSEAMLLKAQILWEGFENAPTAKGCLNRIRELAPEDDKFRRWATSYLETVTGMEEKD